VPCRVARSAVRPVPTRLRRLSGADGRSRCRTVTLSACLDAVASAADRPRERQCPATNC